MDFLPPTDTYKTWESNNNFKTLLSHQQPGLAKEESCIAAHWGFFKYVLALPTTHHKTHLKKVFWDDHMVLMLFNYISVKET